MDKIKQNLMTQNPCYTNGRTIQPRGIMVHSTAAPGAMAIQIRNLWDSPAAQVAVHAILDDTATLQTLPWTARAWHCGAEGNNSHIAFEICEPQECRLLPIEWVTLKWGSAGWAVKQLQLELQARGYDPKGVDGSFGPGCEAALKACQGDLGLAADGICGPASLAVLAKRSGSYLAYQPQETQPYFDAVWASAVALCAALCQSHDLEAADILCHAEGFAKGIASNHADVMHWFPRHGKSMDDFRAAVGAAMDGGSALDAAVAQLAARGIISHPDYWKGDVYSTANVQALIVKMAAAT